MAMYSNKPDDQNERELSFANQREERPRNAHTDEDISEEESAAIAARNAAGKGKRDLAEVPPEEQHTLIP